MTLWLGTGRAPWLLVLYSLAATAQAQADDFLYETQNGAIMITGYTGPGGDVTIPSTINGLPVTSIGPVAFDSRTNLISLTLGDFVTSIENYAFSGCTNLVEIRIPSSVTTLRVNFISFLFCPNLRAISVDPLNSAYSSVDGVWFDKHQTTLIMCPAGRPGVYSIPRGVTSIGEFAFVSCTKLTSVTIPESVTQIRDGLQTIGGGFGAFFGCNSLTNIEMGQGITSVGVGAFRSCTALGNITLGASVTNLGAFAFFVCDKLAGVYFSGAAPELAGLAGSYLFDDTSKAVVYYLPGRGGWGATFGGRPAVLWNPQVEIRDGSFGVRQSRFGFNVVGTREIPLVVEASHDLSAPSWVPLQSGTLTNGLIYFSDPQWTNYPSRFYRIRSP